MSVLLLTDAAKHGESSSPSLGLRAAAYSGLGESKLSTCTWWIENSAFTPPCSRQVQAARASHNVIFTSSRGLSSKPRIKMEAPSSAACATKRSPPSSVAERSGLIISVVLEPNSKTRVGPSAFTTQGKSPLSSPWASSSATCTR